MSLYILVENITGRFLNLSNSRLVFSTHHFVWLGRTQNVIITLLKLFYINLILIFCVT